MDDGRARAFLAGARVVQIATSTADGAPVLRTLNFVVDEGAVCFHGAPAGEKVEALDRRAVAAVEETVASIPSHFLDPERACPATTLYRSVQAHGTLREVHDPARKARVLQALMEKYQPEGGHRPLRADDPFYAKNIAGLLVVEMPIERLDGKEKLGQNRTPRERGKMLAGLWARGGDGDLAAIEAIRACCPDTPLPASLVGPEGVTLHLTGAEGDLPAVVDLLAGEYWNADQPREAIAEVHRRSLVWLVARDASGVVVGSARAISDVGRRSWLYDVIVAPSHRGRGIGAALVRLAVAHPALRRTTVWLGTRDAMGLYEKLGFVRRDALPPRGYPTFEMVLSPRG